MQDMKKRLASVVLAGSLMGATAVGVAAEPTQVTTNGAGGVVAAAAAALNNVNVTDTNVDVAVVELNDSLNNLTALNNVLNNSPILNDNEVLKDVTIGDVKVLNDVVTVGDITLSDIQVEALKDVLNDANIALDDVVGIAVLSGGDLLVFTR